MVPPDKIDFKKMLASYRATHGRFDLVELPELQYLMIDGHGDPNTAPEYSQALEALYPVAYKLKFASKRALGRDYVVPPLEGLWSADEMDSFTLTRDKSQWDWTMLLMLPEWLGREQFAAAVEAVGSNDAPARLADVRLESLAEGCCIQTLHLGPFDDEGPVIEAMHREAIENHNLQLTGKHHEIYLSDPRRTAPEKLRTILRQPVAVA